MITCVEVRSRIALYVDSELTGAEAFEFEAHLPTARVPRVLRRVAWNGRCGPGGESVV